jgi:hypothetical protein
MTHISGNPAPTEAQAQAAIETANAAAQAFIARWQGVTASELSTSQSFVRELCELLGVAVPHPTPDQSYMFERPITFQHGDGSTSAGRVDCYKRGHFVWESKKLKAGVAAQATGSAPSKAFDDALLKARQQAENYARALPAAEGRPPFVVVVDVGHVIELYAEFTRSGATYTPFPDPRNHRIKLPQLADPLIRARLKALWTDPLGLDPSRQSAKVTRQVAAELAELAKSLEAAGHPPQQVAGFLTRCLFSMFAEDVGLLPAAADGSGGFAHLLQQYREQPATLAQMLKVFWAGMDTGGFNAAIAADVLRFNGKLFKGAGADGYALPLTTKQIDGLLRAAGANWQEVEPAIFGTLLERALDPTERHALGAHYTPRAYVERLVLPTVIEPLRADWANAQAAAVVLAREADELTGPKNAKKREAKLEQARAEIRRFHHQLCTTRVLDPACGSGNFLYVTLEHLKRLEGEVLNQLEQFGETQDKLGLEGETVTLQQLRGIELNQRAAALAELVLWIGWLQWHVKTRGLGSVAEPVVHDYGNIENRDAVLAYDRAEPALDANSQTITRWDGTTFKPHPVTGEDVPDEGAQVPQWAYVNPKQAEWPQADFIVGNPPFIGNKRMRDALGDGYAQALRAVWPEVPESADFVMYWWHHAAAKVRAKAARRFGFITTNSISMSFNRRVLSNHLEGKPPLTLAFATPDHAWVDSEAGAAVRVAMTVGTAEEIFGELGIEDQKLSVSDDSPPALIFSHGSIHADLTIGAAVRNVKSLAANQGMVFQGVIPIGDGFKLRHQDLEQFGLDSRNLPPVVKPYMIGADVVRVHEPKWIIDFVGMTTEQARSNYPVLFQHVLVKVKPVRDTNREPSRKKNWWLFARSNQEMRAAKEGLSRFIGTPDASKHKPFVFIDGAVLPDAQVYCIASSEALLLGVLSSCVHQHWVIRVAPRLGVGNDIRWKPKDVWSGFPFPSEDTGLTPALTERIRALAEQLDAHRKARQAAHEAVTLTGLYNVLDKLRRGEPFAAKDKTLHEQGLVSVLQSLHDELDAAVLQAYGWSDLGAVPWGDEAARAAWTETLLTRLVALNAQRAAEEATGKVRWLRPEFQDPARRAAPAAAAESEAEASVATASTASAAPLAPTNPELAQSALEGVESKAEAQARSEEEAGADAMADAKGPAAAVTAATTAQAWPNTLPEQVRAVAQLLSASPAPMPLAAIEASFKGKGPWKKGLPRILETLEALGRARHERAGWRG